LIYFRIVGESPKEKRKKDSTVVGPGRSNEIVVALAPRLAPRGKEQVGPHGRRVAPVASPLADPVRIPFNGTQPPPPILKKEKEKKARQRQFYYSRYVRNGHDNRHRPNGRG
jgi:hypothetical protein